MAMYPTPGSLMTEWFAMSRNQRHRVLRRATTLKPSVLYGPNRLISKPVAERRKPSQSKLLSWKANGCSDAASLASKDAVGTSQVSAGCHSADDAGCGGADEAGDGEDSDSERERQCWGGRPPHWRFFPAVQGACWGSGLLGMSDCPAQPPTRLSLCLTMTAGFKLRGGFDNCLRAQRAFHPKPRSSISDLRLI